MRRPTSPTTCEFVRRGLVSFGVAIAAGGPHPRYAGFNDGRERTSRCSSTTSAGPWKDCSALTPSKAQQLAKDMLEPGAAKEQVAKTTADLLEWSHSNRERISAFMQREVSEQLKAVEAWHRRPSSMR